MLCWVVALACLLYHWGIHTTSGSVDASIFSHYHNIIGTCIVNFKPTMHVPRMKNHAIILHDFSLMLFGARVGHAPIFADVHKLHQL